MRNRITNVTRGVVVLVLSFAVIAPAVPGAAAAKPAPTPGQALEIAPPVIYLSANPGQTVTTKIYLRDIIKSDLLVQGQANDFVASGEDGTPKILLDDGKNNDNPYSIKDWVVPPASLLLVSKEIKTMTITFNVPANASPGGHYGIIRFTATAPSLKDTGVSLSASLGSLILFTVNGKINHSLSVKEFSVNNGGKAGTLLESGPVSFVERIKNDGNEHEQPVGQVSVTNMFNKRVGAVNVNSPPRNILPSSTRKFEQSLDKSVIGNKKLFGRYRADLKITYGNGKALTASKTFWVVPYRLIALLAVLLVAAFFVLRSSLRRYNRRIIEKAKTAGPAPAAKPAPTDEVPKQKDADKTKDTGDTEDDGSQQ